jgi:L-seryl-tRNA(Ser) seleniumtransferase
MDEKNTQLRHLPAVERVLNEPELLALAEKCPRVLLVESAQQAVADLRTEILEGRGEAPPDCSAAAVARRAAALARERLVPSLRRVVNATGTLLHTNLGRSPLSDRALAAIEEVSRSYSTLEYDLATGERGHRSAHVEGLLCRLTGAEAATVVNNNAGAVLLALTAMAKGKEAIVSRGELVEIGGAFRIPEVMAAGGVRLREVGTTNKTRLADYRAALGEETGLLLKVHTSNYRIVGFTETVAGAELVSLGREKGIPVMEDLGSGMLFDLSAFGLPSEPTVSEAVAAGIDVVTFSGDKLLGGPQAGLIVGKKTFVDAIRRHPMARALRIDKLTLAALEATLRHYLDREEAIREIPVLRMMATSAEELEERCRRLAEKLASLLGNNGTVEVVPEVSRIGGGALPLAELPGFAVALSLRSDSADGLAQRLRRGAPPVVGRIQEERLLLNPRTLAPGEEELLVEAVRGALKAGG